MNFNRLHAKSQSRKVAGSQRTKRWLCDTQQSPPCVLATLRQEQNAELIEAL